MYYAETKVMMGGLAHVPILIFIVNFIKGKFESKESKGVEVKLEEPNVELVEVSTPHLDDVVRIEDDYSRLLN